MSPAYLGLFLLLAFLATYFLTQKVRTYALEKNIIDTPNARSSHVRPTPRGGGVGFVTCFLLSILVLLVHGITYVSIAVALFLAGLLIATVGFLDDRGHIAARWRLLAHFSAAFIVLFGMGGAPAVDFLGWTLGAGWITALLGAFFIVWMINLSNFMDGIDGIAAGQAISVSLFGSLLYLANGQVELAILPLSLSATVLGFLVWNFPPAKIFMGDAGSGFLGLVLAALTLQAGWYNPQFLWTWLILGGVFIVDSTYTLIRRLLRREKLYEAHRSHAYQIASRKYKAHRPVTLTVLTINVLWLFPWAAAVAYHYVPGFVALLIAYAPLLGIAVILRAGSHEQ